MAAGAPSNTLGLDLDSSPIQEPSGTLKPSDLDTSRPNLADDTQPPPEQLSPRDDGSPNLDSNQPKEKKKPYVNPERVKTGGTQRDKLSEAELGERMLRMREQNEKIKQRRMDVKADEDAFKKTQESERIRLAQSRKVQEHVNRTREQNARRKMDKAQTREWDSGKATVAAKKTQEHTTKEAGAYISPPSEGGGGTRGSARGSPRGPRGQGRSRGQRRGTGEGTIDTTTVAGSEQHSTGAPPTS